MRVTWIAWRYWPLVGETELLLADRLEMLHHAGITSTVLTRQWDDAWPMRVRHREASVIRFPPSAATGWGDRSFQRAIRDATLARQADTEVVVLPRLDPLAVDVMTRLDRTTGVLVAPAPADVEISLTFLRRRPFRQRLCRRIAEKARLIVPETDVADAFIRLGWPSDRLSVIPITVLPDDCEVGSGPTGRRAARHRLAEISRHLEIGASRPLVLVVTTIEELAAFRPLLTALRQTFEREPGLRVWISGDGPAAWSFWRQIQAWDLDDRVQFIGQFDHPAVLVAAADAVLLPTPSRQGCWIERLATLYERPVLVPGPGAPGDIPFSAWNMSPERAATEPSVHTPTERRIESRSGESDGSHTTSGLPGRPLASECYSWPASSPGPNGQPGVATVLSPASPDRTPVSRPAGLSGVTGPTEGSDANLRRPRSGRRVAYRPEQPATLAEALVALAGEVRAAQRRAAELSDSVASAQSAEPCPRRLDVIEETVGPWREILHLAWAERQFPHATA